MRKTLITVGLMLALFSMPAFAKSHCTKKACCTKKHHRHAHVLSHAAKYAGKAAKASGKAALYAGKQVF